MRRLMTALALGAIALTATAVAQEKLQPNTAQIDYRGFRGLTRDVEQVREQRLVG